jgi:hypothetical protein
MLHIRTVMRASVVALPMIFGAANASTLTVTNTSDSGSGSLRLAIASAVPGDLIVFDPAAIGTIALATSLSVAQSVTIQGPGAGNITLDGQGAVRVINLTAGTLTLSGVTVANGLAAAAKGGGVDIANGATLNVSGSVFIGNHAGNGGAISAEVGGTLTVATSTFQNNAGTTVGGGGIINFGTATVRGNTFLNNTASINGGAVDNQPNATLILENNTFSGNTSVGQAGAVSNLNVLTAINNTFSANQGSSGAAIATGTATITLYNNVFADNVATAAPGAISPVSNGTASNNVFFNNTAGGVEDDQSGYGSSNFVLAGAEPLSPLANNGGPTQTQLPIANGAAVCTGSVALLPGDLTTDQRGFPRTTSGNGAACVDAGSVQLPGGIPTLGTWGLVLLGGLLAMFGIYRMRRPAR